MLEVMVAQIRASDPRAAIGIMTATSEASRAARRLGFQPEEVFLASMDRVLEACCKYGEVMVMGADVLDGAYSPETSVFVWRTAELCHEHGVGARIVGSSFNQQPDPAVCSVVRSLRLRFPVCCRDPQSLRRLRRLSSGNLNLTADVAFLLEPSASPGIRVQLAGRWIEWQKRQKRQVIAVNISQHCVHGESASGVLEFLSSLAGALQSTARSADISVLLLPHDIRSNSDDRSLLENLRRSLRSTLRSRVLLLKYRASAAEVKGLVGKVDMLLTGRMHLAVAALSQIVPPASFVYQGKFEGLYEHFGLPEWLMIRPSARSQKARLETVLEQMIAEREALGSQIRARLPFVLALAEKNFSCHQARAYPQDAPQDEGPPRQA